MVETKQIESTVKAAGEIRKAILALGDLQKEMERARLPIPTHGSTGQSEHEKGGVLIYTVVEGDTLTAIATRHRVSLQSLIRANREMQDLIDSQSLYDTLEYSVIPTFFKRTEPIKH